MFAPFAFEFAIRLEDKTMHLVDDRGACDEVDNAEDKK
jgi:hypothetical protein